MGFKVENLLLLKNRYESDFILASFCLYCFALFILGYIILHATLAMEKLGRWKNTRFNAGHGYRYMHGNGEKSKEEITVELSVGESTVS